MSYPKYESYIDSGLQWLGKIPSHWEVLQSRRLFEQRKERAREGDEQLTASQKYGIISQKKYMELENQRVVQVITGAEILKHVEPNDFVISMRSFQGGLEWCRQSGSVSSAYVGLIPVKYVVPEFFSYLFKCKPYIQALQSTSNLVRDGQALRFDNFSQVWLPVIPEDEQKKIADFLDYEITKIDTLIDKQQQLIQLLKEKRQAVISHAVTKGLNPDAPMRDSGVEWLGEVPEHWSLPKIKWFYKTESGGTPNTSKYEEYYQDGDISWIRSTDLNNGELFETPIAITSKAVRESACTIIPINSVLIAMYGGAGTIGKHSLLKFESAINQAVCAILPSEKIHPEFLHLYIEFYRPYWMAGAEGARKDPNINQETIRELVVSCPPADEQIQIVRKAQHQLFVIDQTISKCDKNIQLMQERRTALISAAVTGKIDVRGFELPQMEKETEAVACAL